MKLSYSLIILGLYNLCLIAEISCQFTAAEVNRRERVCRQKHNISDKDMEEAKGDEHTDPKIKCFCHCLLEIMNLLDRNGKANVENLLGRENVRESDIKLMEKCKSKYDSENDACEYGFKMMVCLEDLGAYLY